MKKVLFPATVDSHILHFHIPYLKIFANSNSSLVIRLMFIEAKERVKL